MFNNGLHYLCLSQGASNTKYFSGLNPLANIYLFSLKRMT